MARSRINGGFWFMVLFALPFAGVGIGFLTVSVIPTLYEWQTMQRWVATPATLDAADLKVSRGSDSTTYRAIAKYHYQFNQQTYHGDRVGIHSGSDNIGSWQQDKAHALESALSKQRDITVYVNPNNPAQSIIYPELRTGMVGFKFVFALVFGGVGIGLIFAAFYGRNKEKARQAAQHLPLWQQDPDWANPIQCGSRAGLIAIGFFAFIWNAISSTVFFAIADELEKGNYAILFALLFPIVGLVLIIYFVVLLLRWRRFGNIPLTLNPWPGAIGGHVGGEVKLPLSYASKPIISATLSCLHCRYTGTGKNRKMTESVHWQKEGIAEIAPAAHGIYARFKFEVPKDLPASEIANDNYYKWTLSLTAPLPGADLNASYDIPVFATGEQSTLSTAVSHAHPELAAQNEQQLLALANIQPLGDGVALDFGYFRRAGLNTVGIIFGGIFAGAGLFIGHDGAPFFMAAIFTFLGAVIMLGSLYALLNRYHVKVGARGIYTERYIAGLLTKKRTIVRSNIEHLVLDKNGSAQSGSKHVEYFVINALLKDGKKVRIAESLTGRGPAEQALAQIAKLSGLAIKPNHQ